MRLLFVCTGNVCRSLLAERLSRSIAARRRLTLESRSCGVAAEGWHEAPPEIWRALAEAGAPRSAHRPQLVSRDLLAWADAVLVMTARQRDVLHAAFPEHAAKVALLREKAGLSGEIADPIGRPWPEYRTCARSIAEALEALLARSGPESEPL